MSYIDQVESKCINCQNTSAKHLKKENRRSLACKIQQDVELMLELLEGTFYKK